MMKTIEYLKKVPEGEKEHFQSVLLVKKIATKVAKNGADFILAELGDKTGSFAVTCFSDSAEFDFFKQNKEGIVVQVQGTTDHYQSRFSPKLLQVKALSEEEIKSTNALGNLIEVSLECPDALWAELNGYIESITPEALKQTVLAALEPIKQDFTNSPAAIAMHHAYRHGLLEHTVHVTRAANALLPFYPEVHSGLALAGAILHDIGKTVEYIGSLSTKKSQTGILQGHVVLGYRMVRKAGMQCKLDNTILERLEHIVLSHQGELEWGAAVMAATPEAVFVSMIDNLDAKMGMVQRAIRQASSDAFSDYMPGLKSPVLTTLVE